MEIFEVPGVDTYSQLLFDLPRYQVIVGARDHLFRLSLEGLQKLEELSWPSTNDTITMCTLKGQSAVTCHNFIMVLLAHNNTIFTCGTNAFNPICTRREISNLNTVLHTDSGVAKCPYSPQQNTTALMTSEGDYYIASMVDFLARDPAIYRLMGPSPMLRTVQYNSKWLSEPNFVSSFEIDNFIYFFFRETAIEFINCGKAIYSRIARVCKNDRGGQYVLKDKWTTFLKARLNCSVPGEYPFYYNEIQSVFFLEREQLLYATFTTPQNSIYGSAICAFNMTSVNKGFNGAFKYQKSVNAAWERSTGVTHKHFQCESPDSPPHDIGSDKYQLMDEAVQPTRAMPIFTQELERFSHIVVDVVATKTHEGLHVLFVATMDGIVKKLSIFPRTQETCLVEVMHVFPKNHTQQIKQMKILKDLNSLYLGSETAVLRIPLSRCGRFQTKRLCLASMDPYCGWHSVEQKCTTPPNNNPLNSYWEQSILTCPILNDPVDGGWGSWSRWNDCEQTGLQTLGDRCLCRSRQCDSPSPANGGKDCKGNTHEVTNCTRHGQWTEWSAWSACSASCGMAIRTRRRTCGNPEPAFGGRYCEGDEKNEIYCTSNPPCPSPVLKVVDGQWSDWTQWEQCSAPCGGGWQARRRQCNNPEPRNGGRDCTGCATDHRPCNKLQCSEERRSHWTPWLISNYTNGGYYQQRFRLICRANVPDNKMIRVAHVKSEDRFCVAGGDSCIDQAFVGNDGDWSEWSTWSTCTAACGGGMQTRYRACDNPPPRGKGLGCSGDHKEAQACNLHMCEESSSGGEVPWSLWSVCDENHYQHRHRTCPEGQPRDCPEAKEESRPCDVSEPVMGPTIVEAGIGVGTMVGACIACFLLGGVITGVLAYFLSRRRRPSSLRHLNNTKPRTVRNHYIAPHSTKNNHTTSLNRNSSLRDSFNSGKRSNKSSLNTMANSEMEKYG